MSFLSSMQVTFHGHKGHDLDAETDITGFVHSLTFTHSVTAPWETITVGMQLPAQLWQKVLAGVPRDDGRLPKPGFWVVVWLFPANKDVTAAKTGKRTAIAWGYVDRVTTGFTHHDNGQQTTMPMHVSCISWLALMGRSALSLAAPQSSTGREGFVYNLDTWDTALKEVLNAITKKNPGEVLQQVFAETTRIYFPTTLTGSTTRDFGQDIPVVWNAELASKYAPTRAAAVKTIQGQAVHSAAQAIPGKASLLSWLYAIFAPDPNMAEMFASLEYPEQGDDGSTSSPTPAAQALGGAQPVLIYRFKPFNLSAINAEALRLADAKDGYGANTTYAPTASQRAGLYQDPVKPGAHGFGDPFYNIPADEVMGVEDLSWDDKDRVNLAFVSSVFDDFGPMKAYDLITAPVVQDLSEFNRYGQRAFDLAWPFVPPVQGQDVPVNQSTAELRTSLDAVGELAWTFVGGREQTCSGRLKSFFVPWRRAGHWFSAELKLQQGNANTRLAFLTGYIDQVTHSTRIVNPDTGHVEQDTIIHFSRGLLSDKPGNFFWTAAGVETRAKRTTAPASRDPVSSAIAKVPKINLDKAIAKIRAGAVWTQNIPTVPLAIGMSFLMTPGVAASVLLDTPAKQEEAVRQLVSAADAARKQAAQPPRGAPTPKFSKSPTSIGGSKASQPSELTIFTLAEIPFATTGYYARGANLIQAVVIHHTAIDAKRTPDSVVNSLKGRTASTHFLIEADGTVFMLLNPDLWIANQSSRTLLNNVSIGIDFQGRLHKGEVTPQQVAAGQLLVDHLCRRYGLPQKVVSKTLRSTHVSNKRPGTNPVDVAALLAQKYTVFRHYNVHATACPGTTPVEQIATPVTWQYSVKYVKA